MSCLAGQKPVAAVLKMSAPYLNGSTLRRSLIAWATEGSMRMRPKPMMARTKSVLAVRLEPMRGGTNPGSLVAV